jgi:hypothetical protein
VSDEIQNLIMRITHGKSYECVVRPDACPLCGTVAVTELPPPIRAEQPDDTVLVCHPALGGCNCGFTLEGES